MKTLFTTMILVASLNSYAQSSLTVFALSTVEDDSESILDGEAMRECHGSLAKRVSPIKSNYKPYGYHFTVWADYICVH